MPFLDRDDKIFIWACFVSMGFQIYETILSICSLKYQPQGIHTFEYFTSFKEDLARYEKTLVKIIMKHAVH